MKFSITYLNSNIPFTVNFSWPQSVSYCVKECLTAAVNCITTYDNTLWKHNFKEKKNNTLKPWKNTIVKLQIVLLCFRNEVSNDISGNMNTFSEPNSVWKMECTQIVSSPIYIFAMEIFFSAMLSLLYVMDIWGHSIKKKTFSIYCNALFYNTNINSQAHKLCKTGYFFLLTPFTGFPMYFHTI